MKIPTSRVLFQYLIVILAAVSSKGKTVSQLRA